MDAVGTAARAIACGEAEFIIAGGVESMSRAPFVMGKAESAFQRSAEIFDTTIGWRFVNLRMREMYGTDSMPETGENVARDCAVERAAQDAFAWRSQMRAARAMECGFFAEEIVPVDMPGKKENNRRVAGRASAARYNAWRSWPLSSRCSRAAP